jgi:hypothetical protein
LRPVRHDASRIFGEFLDEAVDEIPAAAMIPAERSRSSQRISSISKAAMIVSINTVAQMVPFGSPSFDWASRKTSFHSRASRWLSILGR